MPTVSQFRAQTLYVFSYHLHSKLLKKPRETGQDQLQCPWALLPDPTMLSHLLSSIACTGQVFTRVWLPHLQQQGQLLYPWLDLPTSGTPCHTGGQLWVTIKRQRQELPRALPSPQQCQAFRKPRMWSQSTELGMNSPSWSWKLGRSDTRGRSKHDAEVVRCWLSSREAAVGSEVQHLTASNLASVLCRTQQFLLHLL